MIDLSARISALVKKKHERIAKKMNKKGFSLAELLLAVLILLLVSTIVASGIPAAKSAYEKVVVGSNAQVMLSTTIAALRTELGTATDIELNGSGEIIYYSSAIDNYSKIYKAEDSDANISIWVQQFVDKTTGESLTNSSGMAQLTKRQLVTDLKSPTHDKLYPCYDSVSWGTGKKYLTFNNLKVYHGSNSIANIDAVDINAVSAR